MQHKNKDFKKDSPQPNLELKNRANSVMTYPEADDDIYANIYQKLINEIESWTSKTESGFRNTLNYNAIKTQITRPKVGQMINNFD